MVLPWPAIVVGIIIYYRKNFSDFINRIWKLKFPGGIEIEQQKDSQSSNEETKRKKAEEVILKQAHDIEEIKKRYETHLKQEGQNHQQNLQYLLEQLSIKDIQLDFERIYNIIFGGQIALLELLLPIPEGMPLASLAYFYSQVKRYHYPVFEKWTLEMYIQFLVNKQLIEVTQNGNYKITTKGMNFITYITNLNYPKNKNP